MGAGSVTTYQVTVYLAGDLAAIKQVVREFCYERGACVTVTQTTFVYTGGEEEGAALGLVNYPRFPSEPHELRARAEELARLLLPRCNQRSCLMVSTDTTTWLTVDPPGAK